MRKTKTGTKTTVKVTTPRKSFQQPGGLGWQADRPDPRDYFAAVRPAFKALPDVVDLRPMCPPVYNQGSLGSCTAQSVSFLAQFTDAEEKGVGRLPSRLYVYYNTRVLQNSVNEDTGASIRNAMKALAVHGYCRSTSHTDDNTKFKVKPSAAAYAEGDARKLPAKGYFRVMQNTQAICEQINAGNPVVFGFTVFESFMSAAVRRTGIVPMPNPSKEKDVGGHATAIVGYDLPRGVFIVRNSWGTAWGMKGYCEMPIAMVTNSRIASDFWTLNDVA